MNIVTGITLIILSIGAIIGLIALLKMKLVVEKMVVLDVLTTLVTGVLVVVSLIFQASFILDIALIYAILSFGAVLVVARYTERGI